MKRIAISLFSLTLALGLGFSTTDAEAKRLGGGGSVGMSRSSAPMQRQATLPPKQANPASQQAAPAAAPAPAPQASGMSRWLGPLAGIAAGIGLAALLSHFGMGEGMANILMIAALIFGAIFLFRLLFARKATPAPQPAYAGPADNGPARFQPLQAAAAGTGAAADEATIPADFDVAGFLRQAKLNFNRLQAANDAGNMDDIKTFTSPEVFAEVQMQYEERGKTKQQTDVIQLDAELVEVVTEAGAGKGRHIASVRFHGQLREEANAAPINFDEVWHLSKPVDGSEGWRVAGIQQIQ